MRSPGSLCHAALLLALSVAPLLYGSRATSAEPPPLFSDSFEGQLDDGWSWLREEAELWRLRENALEICLRPGAARNVRTALLRDAPDRARQAFAVEVTLTSLAPPTEQYEQAGITWYHQGKPVFKLVKERIDGGLFIIPGRIPMESETVRLRLVVRGREYEAQFRPDGEEAFRTAARGRLPPPGKDQISLQGYHGPAEAEHWVRFDDFQIVAAPSDH